MAPARTPWKFQPPEGLHLANPNQTSLQTMNCWRIPPTPYPPDPRRGRRRWRRSDQGGTEVIGRGGRWSGAPGGEKDEACANAGLAKVEAALK